MRGRTQGVCVEPRQHRLRLRRRRLVASEAGDEADGVEEELGPQGEVAQQELEELEV